MGKFDRKDMGHYFIQQDMMMIKMFEEKTKKNQRQYDKRRFGRKQESYSKNVPSSHILSAITTPHDSITE